MSTFHLTRQIPSLLRVFLLIALAGKLHTFSVHSLVSKKFDWYKRRLDVLVETLLCYVLLIFPMQDVLQLR